MDELLQNLSQATNPEPTIQENLARYINLQIQNPEFGNLLFLILQSDFTDIPPQILSICCNLLKLWAKVQWDQMDYNKRCSFFDCLKNLIMKGHPAINDLSIVFIDVAMHSLSNNSDNIENTRCYESHVYDFFNRISANPPLQQLHALTNIIHFISRKYKHSTSSNKTNEGSEPTLLFTRICNVFIPLFQNEELLTTVEGSEILFRSLSIFKAFFFHIYVQKVRRSFQSKNFHETHQSLLTINSPLPIETAKMMMDKAIIPIDFAQNVLVIFSKRNILDFRLVAHCCRFLNSFYKLTIFNDEFAEITRALCNFEGYFTTIENILQVNFSVLSFALEIASSDTFLIPSILRDFETFRKFLPPQIEMLNAILTSSQLTSADKEEFFNSPNIFYLNVYEKFKNSDSNSAPQISKSIIFSMVKKNYQLLLYMLSLPQEHEHVIRCIGYCLPLLMQHRESENYEIVMNALNQYYVSLIQLNISEPIFIAAQLYFLYHFVPFLPDEHRQNLMNNVVSHYFGLFLHQVSGQPNSDSNINDNNLNGFVIITLNACKLFKRLLKYDVSPFSFEVALQTLVTFHSFCFTTIVIDSIRLMVGKEREKIIPFAESIIEKVIISIDIAFAQYLDAAGDPNQIEAASKSISSNLDLCSMLIESSASSCLVKPSFCTIVQVIFQNEVTDCIEELVHFLSIVFETDSCLIPHLTQVWFAFCLSKEWVGFIDQLIEPFFSIISTSPHLFLQLQVIEKIEEICLTYLIDQTNLSNIESVYQFASLISWICLIEPSFDASPEFQCVQLICGGFCNSFNSTENKNLFNLSDFNIVLIASLFDVMAALTVSRKIIPPQPILLTIVNVAVNSNWILKADQKRLYSIFLLTIILSSKSGNDIQEEFLKSALLAALDLLNEELIQRSLGSDDYFADFDRCYPNELAFLTEEETKFTSPQEKINVSEILIQAISLFSNDFTQSLKSHFPKVFASFLT